MNFVNAIKVTVAAALPVILFAYLDQFHVGFTIALGALLIFPSDINSNLKHKINGIIVASLIVSGSAFVISIIHPIAWVFYPVFSLMIFFLSMIAVYGHRAMLVSFSGLLSICLAFNSIYEGRELLEHCGFLLLGGLFYFIVSMLFYFIRPYRYAELQIAECSRLTSKYLKLRADLWTIGIDRQIIVEKQLRLQVELNTIHENIREALMGKRSGTTQSNQNRKLLLVFISLVEILELGLSNSFDHEKLHKKFSTAPKVLVTYQNLAYNLASVLRKIAMSLEKGAKYKTKHSLLDDLLAYEKSIKQYQTEFGDDATEGAYMLTNMLHYAGKQVEKILLVERVFTTAAFAHDISRNDKDLEKFLKPQYYPFSILRENLSFSSPIFRHSLRLTVTLLIGYIVGQLLPFQNVYWILLTIVVIMRPGYGLTKERSINRIIGTVIGGLIAFGIILFVQNSYVISTLAVISMILGFAFTQTNYKVGATFITMYVVFIYAMLTPNVQDVVQFRILDTGAGALLAVIANYLLWPSWEFLSAPVYMGNAIKSNRNYLNEISLLYNNKGDVPVSYRVARKEAFIDIGNLMASFQRMAQEPKSKQKQMSQVYRLAVTNHTLLSSLASLGTFMQSHKTTRASEAFNVVVNTAIKNLEDAGDILSGNPVTNRQSEDLTVRFLELKNIREKELSNGTDIDEKAFHDKMREAQLIIEQLLWMTTLTENILKTVKALQSED